MKRELKRAEYSNIHKEQTFYLLGGHIESRFVKNRHEQFPIENISINVPCILKLKYEKVVEMSRIYQNHRKSQKTGFWTS